MHSPYTILIILFLSMVLFIWGYWRYDIVAVLALGASVAVGAVPFDKVYIGLSNPAVITVACVMIISQAIHRTGLISLLVQRIQKFTRNQTLHITLLCVITATLSAFMNNIGALALMMPISIQTAIANKRSPSTILMPIALASALGGLTTLIGTPSNLLVAAYRQQAIGKPFSLFAFAHVGLFVAIIGVLFVGLVGWHLIPKRENKTKISDDPFQVQDYITEIKVIAQSAAIDKTVSEFEKLVPGDFLLIGVIRNEKKRLALSADFVLEEDDILIVEASPDDLQTILEIGKLELVGSEKISSDMLKSDEIGLLEAVVPPGSRIEKRSSVDLRLRSRYHMNLLAISRQGTPFKDRLHQLSLRAGDVVLLQGATETLRENAVSIGFLPLAERSIQINSQVKKWLALIIFVLAIIAAATNIAPVELTFGAAVIAMVLTKCIPARLIYDAVDWPIIILLAAMIPVGNALETTGGTIFISHLLTSLSHHWAPIWIIGLMLIFTMTLSDFMNNAATTVVMAPIAISIAQAMQVSIDPFLMAVAIGASCPFLTPVGHQNNTLIMGPGGYKFYDYIRIGLPLEIIVICVATPLIMFFWM